MTRRCPDCKARQVYVATGFPWSRLAQHSALEDGHICTGSAKPVGKKAEAASRAYLKLKPAVEPTLSREPFVMPSV